MAVVKVVTLVMGLISFLPMFGWGIDGTATRPTRAEAGLPGRPELPTGSYFDQLDGDCNLAHARVQCKDFKYSFFRPFTRCPQNGCYNLKLMKPEENADEISKNIECVDTCNNDEIIRLPRDA